MSRHSRFQTNELAVPLFFLVDAAVWVHRAQLLHLVFIFISVVALLVLIKLTWYTFRNLRNVLRHNIDSMDGLEFEKYVASLLRINGFHKVSLTERYDYGVDIIAEKGGVRWGIQTKRYTGLVMADAVRQVVTGLRIYNCDKAMVITNSTYSTVARRLADANDCVLIDRAGLKRLEKQRCIL